MRARKIVTEKEINRIASSHPKNEDCMPAPPNSQPERPLIGFIAISLAGYRRNLDARI
jgi:hypothetical protein